jgi:hypothetical protein
MEKIAGLYVFITKEKNEKIIRARTIEGWFPLIGTNMKMVRDMEKYAEEIKKINGIDYEIKHFVLKEK